MKDKNNNEFLNTLIYLSAPESFVTRRLVFARVFRQKREKKKRVHKKYWIQPRDEIDMIMMVTKCVCVCVRVAGRVGW